MKLLNHLQTKQQVLYMCLVLAIGSFGFAPALIPTYDAAAVDIWLDPAEALVGESVDVHVTYENLSDPNGPYGGAATFDLVMFFEKPSGYTFANYIANDIEFTTSGQIQEFLLPHTLDEVGTYTVRSEVYDNNGQESGWDPIHLYDSRVETFNIDAAGSLEIEVQDQDGVIQTGAVIFLYDDTYSYLDQKADADDGDLDGKVNWSSLAPGAYNVEAYFDSVSPFSGTEFWKSANLTISSGTHLQLPLQRDRPYAQGVAFAGYDNNEMIGPREYPKAIPVGINVKADIVVDNVQNSPQDVRVRLYVDQDKNGSMDLDVLTQVQTVPGNSSALFEVPFTADSLGVYYYAVLVETLVNSNYVMTDAWQWGPEEGVYSVTPIGTTFVDDWDSFDNSRWVAIPDNSPDPDCSTKDPDNVVIENGSLLLLNEGQFTPEIGAEVESQHFYHYGWYSARLAAGEGPDVMSAFFTFRFINENNQHEIDVELYEHLDTGWAVPDLIARAEGTEEKGQQSFSGYDATEEHVYHITWLPNQVTIRVDGQVRYDLVDHPAVPFELGKLLFNTWGIGNDWGTSYNCSSTTTTQMKVDWVTYKDYIDLGAAMLFVSPQTRLDYGTVAVGETKDLDFELANVGGETLVVLPAVSEPFSIVNPQSLVLYPGESTTVTVRFAPSSAQSYQQTISFDGGNEIRDVTGSGEVSATSTNTPTFTYTPTSTYTFTPTSTYTFTPTPTFTQTLTPTYTSTATPTPQPTNTPTHTATPSAPAGPVPAILPYSIDFEAGLDNSWRISTTNNGRVQVSSGYSHNGIQSLKLDSSPSGVYSNAGAILYVDTTSVSDPLLRFWWREFYDENHAEDGVFIRDSQAATWCQVLSFNNGPSTYLQEEIDLQNAATGCGITLSTTFQVMFQYRDNYPITSDGYAIDDVEVVSGGSGATSTLAPTATVTPVPTATFTSTSAPVVIPATMPYSTGFETAALDNAWSVTATNNGRYQLLPGYPHSGNQSLRLDASQAGPLSLATTTLHIDLSSALSPELRFWWREFADENHAEDGVFIRDVDASSWCQVVSFNNGNSTYREEIVDLASAAQSCGMALTGDFQIAFQFYDNYPISSDGYSIDDVTIDEAAAAPTATVSPTVTPVPPTIELLGLTVVPNNITHNGQCPLTLEAQQVVRFNVASQINYQWYLDGQPAGQPKGLSVNQPYTTTLTHQWTIDQTVNGVVKLQMTGPYSDFREESFSITVNCTP